MNETEYKCNLNVEKLQKKIFVTNKDVLKEIDLSTTDFLGTIKYTLKPFFDTVKMSTIIILAIKFAFFITLVMHGVPISLSLINVLTTIPNTLSFYIPFITFFLLIETKLTQVLKRSNIDELINKLNNDLNFDITKEDLENVNIETLYKSSSTVNGDLISLENDKEELVSTIPTKCKQVVKVAKLNEKDKLKYIRQVTFTFRNNFFKDSRYMIDIMDEKEYNDLTETIKKLKLTNKESYSEEEK